MEKKEDPRIGYRQQLLCQALALSDWCWGWIKKLGELKRPGWIELGPTQKTAAPEILAELEKLFYSERKRLCSISTLSTMVGFEKIRLNYKCPYSREVCLI